MKFIDWFDEYNVEHIKAYRHLQKTGAWPKGFKPDNVVTESHWIMSIVSKMADAWVKFYIEQDLRNTSEMNSSEAEYPISKYTGNVPSGKWTFVKMVKGTKEQALEEIASLEKADPKSAYRIWDDR